MEWETCLKCGTSINSDVGHTVAVRSKGRVFERFYCCLCFNDTRLPGEESCNCAPPHAPASPIDED
jgi:hypothetical protein